MTDEENKAENTFIKKKLEKQTIKLQCISAKPVMKQSQIK